MLIFPIVSTNVGFVIAMNGGVIPEIGDEMQYFVIQPGEPNQIISSQRMVELSAANEMKITTQLFSYCP